MSLTKEQKENLLKVVNNAKCPFCGGNIFSFPKEGDVIDLAAVADTSLKLDSVNDKENDKR